MYSSFFYRSKQNWGNQAFFPKHDPDEKLSDILNSFVSQFYENKSVPSSIILSEEIKEKYAEGNITKGFVKNLTDYGAFIDLGGMDGLLHITDISWKRINHPQEILKVGDEIDVQVLKFDDEKNRVSLGMKQLTDDPWDKVDGNIELDAMYEGKVVNVADYGVFVELQAGVEALLHVSEMSWSTHLRSANDFFSKGDDVEAKILTLDREQRKMSLG